jgi:chromate transporter
MKGFLELYWTFFKIEGLTFGGGYAMLPFLYKLAEVYPWLAADAIPDISWRRHSFRQAL